MTPSDDLLEEPALPRVSPSPGTMAAIFVGGALGTLARYLLDTAHPAPAGHFPLTTLLINLSGSLAIGFAVPLAERFVGPAPWIRPLAIVGLLGGWTTYSTLAVDSVLLAKGGHGLLCAGYLAATVIGGIAAVMVGNRVGRKVAGA